MPKRATLDPKTPLDQIDPEWAWQAWEPSEEEPWNQARLQLLLRRGGFGASPSQRKEALRRGPDFAWGLLVGEGSPGFGARQESFEQDSAAIASAVRAGGNNDALAAWWLHRMLHTPTPLVEKMTLFWHGHFATGAEKVMDSDLMYEQNRLLRNHALGDFRPMVQGISKDPAMLIYLDSATNRKAHPNENYARELMELFCLGEGNYTEQDVQELARCFTGWEIRRKMFRFNAYQHDSGTKTILGQSGIESGESAVDCVLTHPAMPRFVATKLFRYFVCDEPGPTEALIEPLAEHFIASEFSIGALVAKILRSRMMLSLWSSGRKVRAPVEWVIEWMRTLEASSNLERVTRMLRPLGQALFFPPSVKGWDGGRAWINSSTLIGRANFMVDWLGDDNTRFHGKSLDAWCKEQGLDSDEAWIEWLAELFLANPLTETERQRALASTKNGSRVSAAIALSRIPKIHLS